MAIQVRTLLQSIVAEARGIAGEQWAESRAVAETELRKLAQCACDIERLLRNREIDEQRARELFSIHRTAARTALLSVKALTASMAEGFITKATAVIGKAITRSLGVNLF